MSGPWEDYASQSAGPWADYSPKTPAPKAKRKASRGDVAKSFLTGVKEGVAGVADLVAGAGPLGVVESAFKTAGNVRNVFQGKRPETGAPFSRLSDAVSQGSYKPETTAGEWARTAGQMAPNVFAPGSAAGRVANVVLPTVGTEVGGRVGRKVAGEKGEAAGRIIGGVTGGVAASLRRAPAAPRPAPEAAATEAMQEIGIDISVVPQETRARAIRMIEDGRTPEEVAMFVSASEGTPVPIPLRRGDMTGNPVHQHAENMALRGAYGERPAGIMQGQVARQQDALRGNVNVFANQLAGGAARPVGQGATPAAERLVAMRDTAEAGVSAAYRTAREADRGARLPREQGPVLAQRLREGVEDYDMTGVPRVAAELARFDNRGGPVDVRDVFSARARLNKLTQSADPVEAGAAASAKRALDSYVDEALEAGNIQGDADSVGRWREAIGQRREVGERFESNDLVEHLTERAFRNGDRRALKVDPGEAANVIFGRANNFGAKRNLYRDMERLRETLGPNSGEWNSVRAEAFQRIARAGEGGVEAGERQFSGVKFQKAWQDFLRDDPRLANALFTPEERGRIGNFATIAARVTSPVKGGDNPSNSAVSALKLLPAFIKNLPLIQQVAKGVDVQVKVNSTVRAVNPQPSRAPRPRAGLPRANVFAGAGPAALASGRSTDEER